ncbi:hypothetical protein BDQ12DRAFT_523977 [Crucibulum laeve]|uniref:Uncharacterized protein n=1 Tax=Crucibulum laeve TaxID=68775 RepID=A0A5C3LGH3_9AGAR|nr:hypothetical protein BDQ12DRAFT_523977 [Crucibulum laeve]
MSISNLLCVLPSFTIRLFFLANSFLTMRLLCLPPLHSPLPFRSLADAPPSNQSPLPSYRGSLRFSISRRTRAAKSPPHFQSKSSPWNVDGFDGCRMPCDRAY